MFQDMCQHTADVPQNMFQQTADVPQEMLQHTADLSQNMVQHTADLPQNMLKQTAVTCQTICRTTQYLDFRLLKESDCICLMSSVFFRVFRTSNIVGVRQLKKE